MTSSAGVFKASQLVPCDRPRDVQIGAFQPVVLLVTAKWSQRSFNIFGRITYVNSGKLITRSSCNCVAIRRGGAPLQNTFWETHLPLAACYLRGGPKTWNPAGSSCRLFSTLQQFWPLCSNLNLAAL